ncbi:MAG: M3 family metallopeptidase [Bacteroidales bacterium]|nr:M3 family metallopeptidase [Bacteroidales bacterium]
MKKIKPILLMSILVAGLTACSEKNPLLENYQTWRDTPPFAEVKTCHLVPAYEEAIRRHDQEIQAIVAQTEAPDFANTIEALELSGKLISRIDAVFGTLTNNEMDDELMAAEEKITLMLSEHFNAITLNEGLFDRVRQVYEKRHDLGLNAEQLRLTEETYEDFLERGSTLQGADREKYRSLSTRLDNLTMTFGQNSLKATHAFSRVFTDKEELSGLPDDEMAIAAEKARKQGKEGWLFDLTAPSYGAIMKYADRRDVREQFYMAYNQRAVGGEFDNLQVIKDIVNTRMEIGQLMGYPDYASYALRRKMAGKVENVYQMLDQLRAAYRPVAVKEHQAIQEFINQTEPKPFKLEPWDWSYYSNKLKTKLFDLNDEMLKPYFELEHVKKGVFGLATRLYGITFVKNPDIQVWNKDVDAYEVFDENGDFMAVIYTDFFPRESKRSGAWMNDIKAQSNVNGQREYPFVTLSMNFTLPTADKPSLLTFDEVTTFLHEFGHGLHGMLSNVTYASLAGTNVDRDFVEMPSQIMENWAYEKEFLDSVAIHYQTGEPIPMELIGKVRDAGNFNVGRDCCRQLSFGYLDMAYHTIHEPLQGDVAAFEREAWKSVDLLPMPVSCCMSPTFTHLFSGGYAAGYYCYKWSEILAFDAYDHYTEHAVFDRERAASFRENILSKGNTKPAAELYEAYRGQPATIDAMLRHNGIK